MKLGLRLRARWLLAIGTGAALVLIGILSRRQLREAFAESWLYEDPSTEDVALLNRIFAEADAAYHELQRREPPEFARARTQLIKGRGNGNYYDRYLDAMGEPRLGRMPLAVGTDAYRFVWIRSFDEPILVRAEWTAGHGTLTSVALDADWRFLKLKANGSTSRTLTRAEWDEMIACFDAVLFTMYPEKPRTRYAPDGAMWLVEGYREGRSLLVERMSPEADDPDEGPFRRCCLLMLRLRGIDAGDVY